MGAYTKIGYFESDADLLYQDEIHGSILDQIDQIVELVHLKYMKAKITYEGMKRIERCFIPEAALREANPNIAHVFYLAGFIESWGRGIEKICNACREDEVPQPKFIINPSDIMIKFAAPEDRLVRTSSERVTDKVTVEEQQLLSLLIEDPAYTYQELADKLSTSRKTVSEKIKNLKGKKIIERIGSDKKGCWRINRNTRD